MEETASSANATHRTSRAIRVVFVGALALALAGWGLWEIVEDRFVPKRWAPVHEGELFRSGELDRALVERVWRENEIDVVVCLSNDQRGDPHHEAAQDAATTLGIDRQIFNLNGDGTGRAESFAGALARLRQAHDSDEVAVVHCAAGLHRTGAVVAAYRLLYDGWDGPRAYEEMISFGPDNPDLIARHLNQKLPEITRMLVEQGALDAIPDPMPRMPEE